MKKRISAVALLLVFIIFSAFGCAKQESDYIVLGEIKTSNQPKKYNFSQTLYNLYSICTDIVLATIKNVDTKGVTFLVDETLIGDYTPDSEYRCQMQGLMPAINKRYMLFINSKGQIATILTDSYGLLRINGEKIYPETGGSAYLEQVRADIDKLQNYTILPPNFLYYRQIEKLIESCDYIFIGQVSEIRQPYYESFYLRSGGVEEIVSAPVAPIVITPIEIIKGDFIGEMTALFSRVMFDNTIVEHTLKPTSYTMEDTPTLAIGDIYMFFTIDSPIGMGGEYTYFINPFQGYVPIYGNQLMSIPINAPFSEPMDLETVRGIIDAVMDGSFVSIEYDAAF